MDPTVMTALVTGVLGLISGPVGVAMLQRWREARRVRMGRETEVQRLHVMLADARMSISALASLALGAGVKKAETEALLPTWWRDVLSSARVEDDQK